MNGLAAGEKINVLAFYTSWSGFIKDILDGRFSFIHGILHVINTIKDYHILKSTRKMVSQCFSHAKECCVFIHYVQCDMLDILVKDLKEVLIEFLTS